MKSGFTHQALPLSAAVLPLLTINLCYMVAISLDHLPMCVPYISGCTSVSSTGRSPPESLIFRAGMLPSAIIMLLFWRHCCAFLGVGMDSPFMRSAIRLMGTGSAVFLVLYTLTLGIPGDGYRLVRRVGINGFALCNFAAQVLFVFAYRRRGSGVNQRLLRWLSVLCMALPALAIAAEIAKWAGAERHVANNIAAWNAFVVLSAFYAAMYRLWRHHGMSAGIPTSPRE